MPVEITRANARIIRKKLMNFAIAPGKYAHFINAGTDAVLSVIEKEYFKEDLVQGVSCFKYLEGDYGSGKTQFIQSLAERAKLNEIVTSIVEIGNECPFNSQSSIYSAVVSSFVASEKNWTTDSDEKGIEILLRTWIRNKLCELGWTPGQEVTDSVRRRIEQTFTQIWLGAPDTQMASAIMGLGQRILENECGAQMSPLDSELIAWVKGDNVRSRYLREKYGLHEPTRDESAFKRLKTVIEFLRSRLGCKGFFIAFDEGTRTNTFRRGSVKQKQSIENMLTMINDAGGEFSGVMFLYAATPDFKSDVIQKYSALADRIGSVAYIPGRPMTPLIILETLNTADVIREIGKKILYVFAKAENIDWTEKIQFSNIDKILQGIRNVEYLGDEDPILPRQFVYPYCRFLEQQKHAQHEISVEDAEVFINTHVVPAAEGGQ